MTAITLTSHTNPVRYFLAAGAGLVALAGLAALVSIWTWSARPMEVLPGQLSSTESITRVMPHRGHREMPVSELFSRVSPGMQDPGETLISNDVAWWWPEHVDNAALAFHCAPKASQDIRHSVMVWTDTRNNVVAYGTAIQGGLLPSYATGLSTANEPDVRRIVYAAAQGFHVVAARKTYALKIKDTTLACVPSKGD